jgi:hypothetical protein
MLCEDLSLSPSLSRPLSLMDPHRSVDGYARKENHGTVGARWDVDVDVVVSAPLHLGM